VGTAPKTIPAPLEEAVSLLDVLQAENRYLEFCIKSVEDRLFGSRSEKLPIEDQQLGLIDEVFA
jgi:hypothetical protein